ncbi:chorismate-binding protein [Dokdonia sp.]|uniref:chorismate-binding protein n=1 Tax=Dokdonia sp. TaxID=2024995 RepID=UPI003263B024
MTNTSFFEHITNQFDDVLPFVAYRKPGESHLYGFYQETDVVHYLENFEESGFAFAPFDECQKGILIPETYAIQCEYIATDSSETVQEFILPKEDQTDKEIHISLVQSGIDEILENGLKKVVLSRKRTFPNTLTAPITIFKKLLQTYANAFVYIWYHPKVGLWLGATPETLLSVKNKRVYTMSLAGTQKYTNASNIIWGTKEIEEQQLVTDTIVSRLEPLVQEIIVGTVENHQAGSLLHLKTAISAKFDETKVTLQSIIKALHPTPAVCGLPVDDAKAFILENEHYDRSFYTGFLGELNITRETTRSRTRRNVENLAYRSVKKSTHLFVNLRCMERTAAGTHVYVGGGITAASIPDAEWEETVHKLGTMGKVLF